MHGFFAGGAAGCRKKFTKKILFSLDAAKNVRYHGKKNHGQREPRPAPERMIFVAQTTKRALEASLKKLLLHKPLNKITINDITEDCGVNRMTFYYHFKDIYDLIEWACLEDGKRALADKKTYSTWSEGLEQIFEAVLENKPFILNVYHSVSQKKIESYLYKLTYDLLADVVEEECRDAAVSGEDKALIAEFYKYGFVGMMLHWIDGGMKADYRELVQRLSTMLHGSILNAARNFEQKQSASLSKETE